MRLEDFKYVSEIAKHGSFSKASKTLFVSQPALSKAVIKLENELGIELFKRDKTSVILTAAGELFLNEGNKVIEITNNLIQEMNALSLTNESTLRIGSSQFYIKYFFPHIIPYFNKKYPNINIKITEGVSSLTEQYLLDADLDLAIVPLPLSSPKLDYTTIYEETFQLAYCSSNEDQDHLYRQATTNGCFDLSYFQDEPFILLKHGFKMRKLSESIFESYGFQPKVVFETENYDTINSLISNNYGVSILPSFITKYDNVSYVKLDCESSRRHIVATYLKSSAGNKIINEFIKCLQTVLQENLEA
ncbi:LysR family transcriptional regulator [Acidaminobacter hydrogenoformans]|uniref:Regulatory helix-turn-helix protein, lysR family n=1 Tax=Acidaminobacter hydrogenoformans DSM 2784 TaxID=1120920 RepID=A0A1G5S6S0_9FIRM|nr:LysR family transcriptional regulator [Acidaminobacter hydrogenoformans]SCZ81807.1 regulatory helix-turn-helix protein, lysR family [Acidaminobacter hydrogenoformans DSM 2784]